MFEASLTILETMVVGDRGRLDVAPLSSIWANAVVALAEPATRSNAVNNKRNLQGLPRRALSWTESPQRSSLVPTADLPFRL